MKKFKKIGISFIFLLAIILAASDADTMQAASTGYAGHTWETPSTCSTCGGDHSIGISCSTCGGDGTRYSAKCPWCSTTQYNASSGVSSSHNCSSYGGVVSLNYAMSVSCTACGGDGISSSKACTRCYASGTYKGKNTRCTTCVSKGTGAYYYAAWSAYPNGDCYPLSYTQTINHYLWNGDISAWDYWTTTYGSATYGTTYTPSYTTTPNGYYNYDISWKTGWTVSGAGTFSAYYYPNTYYVSYDANSGAGAPEKQSFLYNSTAYISATEPTRRGYTFTKWWATHTSNTYFSPGQAVPKGWGSFTLRAQWQANDYTITLAPNGGTCVNSAGQTVDSVKTTFDTSDFSALNYCVPKRTGYTFLGWYDALEGGTQVYDANGNCTNEGTYWKNNKWAYADDVTLYAQWEQNEYTVTYDANGGSTENTTRTYHYNDEVDLSLTAEKDGKIFVGWNTDPNAKIALNTLIMPDLATSDNVDYASDWELTLYAIYSIQVSDVANHTYPDYEKVKEQEVFLRIWESGNESNCKDYTLSYEYDTNKMVYRYAMDIEATDFVKDMSAYCYAVYAYDNAGNWKVLATDTGFPPDVTPQKYTQTVNHYRYDAILKNWVKFDTTKEEVEKGKLFTPSFTTVPTGYQTDSITYPDGYSISNGSYVVSEPATSSAYYKPMDYTLFFDVNASDGSVTPTKKKVTYGGRYGELPTPERTGYTFQGWYTEKKEGTLITPSMKYEIPGNSTIYAHWELNTYKVTYDYWTNGGTYSSVLSKNTPYGIAVDLSVTATKNGYTFVGWNTDPDATSKLDSLIMEDKELVLYAIYKKDITATFVDSYNGTKRTVTTTVYNNQTDGAITIPAQNTISGWTSLGWSLSQEAEAAIDTTPGAEYVLSENTTFYGCYVKDITLSYDTNGSGQSFDAETKERYYNAYGNYSNPMFTITAAPTLSEHSFVAWVDKATGDEYQPGDAATITVDTLLTARWDAFPEIEAYDRYFTLEEAQSGEITPERLLEKVTGTDKEDGVLINGEDVIVLDYNASDFLDSTEVEITYQATDSFGNTVEKTVTVHVVDTTVKKSPRVRYTRFISSRFYADETGSLLAPEKGGLELTSVWRNNDSYKSVLERVLYNKKLNEEYKTIEYFGTSTEVKIAGSGEWQTEKSTWVFTKDDIEEVKSFVDTHGYGNIREPNALELFIEAFRKCLKLN